MYWTICISILIVLVALLAYIRRVAARIKNFHTEYNKELATFNKHAHRELFDWDEVSKRRVNEIGGEIP
jgi:hypothetical protein